MIKNDFDTSVLKWKKCTCFT